METGNVLHTTQRRPTPSLSFYHCSWEFAEYAFGAMFVQAFSFLLRPEGALFQPPKNEPEIRFTVNYDLLDNPHQNKSVCSTHKHLHASLYTPRSCLPALNKFGRKSGGLILGRETETLDETQQLLPKLFEASNKPDTRKRFIF